MTMDRADGTDSSPLKSPEDPCGRRMAGKRIGLGPVPPRPRAHTQAAGLIRLD